MRHALSLGTVLLGIWLLWSGHFEPLLVGFGVLSCTLVVWIVLRMEVADHETAPFHLTPRAALYLPWLLWQIAKSNVDVARRLLHPRLPIAPRVFRVPTTQSDPFGRVIYANSITLTPGTISVRLHRGQIVVHALSAEAAADLRSGEMDRRVTAAVGTH